MIQEAIGAKTLEAWEPVFRENDIWFAKVQSVQEVIDDEQVAMALLDLEASAADLAAAGDVAAADVSLRTVASPVDFDSVISQPRAPVPSVGEHTAEILEGGWRGRRRGGPDPGGGGGAHEEAGRGESGGPELEVGGGLAVWGQLDGEAEAVAGIVATWSTVGTGSLR